MLTEICCWSKLYGYPMGIAPNDIPHYKEREQRLEAERKEKVKLANEIYFNNMLKEY